MKRRDDAEPTHAEPRAGDVKDSLADIGQAKSLIGYDVVTAFDEGLRKTVDWYRSA